MTANQKVGYGNPPKEGQFKTGQSGNPKGRPKGSENLATTLRKVLGRKVQIIEKGKKRSVTILEAVVLALRSKALSLDIKAIKLLLEFASKYLPSAVSTATQTLPAPFIWTDDDSNLTPFLEEIANGKPIDVQH